MVQTKKIIIVGAGLSGLSVAYQLLEVSPCEITIYDENENYSSLIAAGIINPLVFRRMTKSWRVDEFIPSLNDFYKNIEQKSNSKFHFPLKIRRLFSSKQEHDFWESKQNLPEFEPYMEKISAVDYHYSEVKNDFGSGVVKNASYIDTPVFLENLKELLSKNCSFVNKPFDFSLLLNNNYDGNQFDEIIFCEGYKGLNNPHFNLLPLTQTKGETLTIKNIKLPENESVNRKCFVLPLSPGVFKIGSTYTWNTADLSPTKEGKNDILNNLSFLTNEKPEIINHSAGIRPTTVDRRPLMGTHPTMKNYHYFNGLGAKGYMLAPRLSFEFAEYLLKNKALNKEVNLTRVYSKL